MRARPPLPPPMARGIPAATSAVVQASTGSDRVRLDVGIVPEDDPPALAGLAGCPGERSSTSASLTDDGGRRPSAPTAPNAGPAPGPPRPNGRMTRLQAPTPRVAVVIAAAIVIGFVLLAAGSAIRPFVVGLLLAYLLDPLVERFARRGVRAAWRSCSSSRSRSAWSSSRWRSRSRRSSARSRSSPTSARHRPGDPIPARPPQRALRPARAAASCDVRRSLVAAGLDAAHHLDISFLRPLIDSAASFVTSIFGYLILPAWLFFLLKDRPRLQGAMDRALPTAWRPDTWAIAGIVHEVFGKWVRGQLLLGAVVGLASFIGLTILGFTVDPIFGRFAVLLAIIAGLGELIPIIGPIISAVPAVLLGLTAGPVPALAALLLYLAIQLVENNYLVPKIQSDAIDLHPSAIITALVIGGAIFGLLGAILALPVTAAFPTSSSTSSGGPARSAAPSRAAARRPRQRSPRWRPPAAGSPWRQGRSPSDDRSARPGLRPIQGPPDRPGGRSRDRQVVYRRLARKYHPDVTPGPDAANRMLELNTAFENLGDAARRERFDRDRALREQARRDQVIRPSESGPPDPARAPGGHPGAGAARGTGPDLGRWASAARLGPRPSRATGRAAGRRSAVATTRPGCGRQTARAPRGRRRAIRPGPCSTSAATRAGRWARCPVRPRVPRMARPDGDRSGLPRRGRRAAPEGRSAPSAQVDDQRRGLFRRR